MSYLASVDLVQKQNTLIALYIVRISVPGKLAQMHCL